MIFNVGYLTGVTGRISEYLFKVSGFIFPNMISADMLKNLTSLVERTKPDILFLSEVRDQPYMAPIKDLFAKSCIDIKYKPGSIFNSLPFFYGNCNGIFLRNPLPTKKLFIKNGSKKLVYQIALSKDCSILFSHFALGKRTRKKQFSEIAQIASQSKQVIIAGDFNIFKGAGELQDLLEKADVRLVNNFADKTFPGHNPTHAVDLFLASPSIRTVRLEVVNGVFVPDHLPVVADFELEL